MSAILGYIAFEGDSCSHLVLSVHLNSASIPFVHVPPHVRLTLDLWITPSQHVPTPFQPRAHAVNSYLITCFKSMSPFYYFLYITNTLLLSFTLSTDHLSHVIKCDKPKGCHTLAYFISISLIVHPVCALILKDFILYL